MAQQYETQFAIVDPVNPSNNTARNSQQTTLILEKFRSIHTSLKLLSQQKQQEFLESRRSEVEPQQVHPTLGVNDFPTVEQTAKVMASKEEFPKVEEGGKSQASQSATRTDDANEQQISCPDAQQKAQEQEQQLLPAEGSAGQECTASAQEKLTTRVVDPAQPSSSHNSSEIKPLASMAAEGVPTLASLFDTIEFVERFLSIQQQPEKDDSPPPLEDGTPI